MSRTLLLLAVAVAGCAGPLAAPAAPIVPAAPVAVATAEPPRALPAICAQDLSTWSPGSGGGFVSADVQRRALSPAVLALQARVCACAATSALPASLDVSMHADPARGRTEVTTYGLDDPCIGTVVATYPAFELGGDDLDLHADVPGLRAHMSRTGGDVHGELQVPARSGVTRLVRRAETVLRWSTSVRTRGSPRCDVRMQRARWPAPAHAGNTGAGAFACTVLGGEPIGQQRDARAGGARSRMACPALLRKAMRMAARATRRSRAPTCRIDRVAERRVTRDLDRRRAVPLGA